MRSLLGSVGHAYYNMLFLGNLFAFLDLVPRVAEPQSPAPAAGDTCGHAASTSMRSRFASPGSQRTALDALDLGDRARTSRRDRRHQRRRKSTPLKLVCRFYDPQGGRVALNGVDVRGLPIEELRSQVTVLIPGSRCTTTRPWPRTSALHPAMARATRADIEAARAAGAEELSRACRRATRRRSASGSRAAWNCRRASGSASHLRAPSCARAPLIILGRAHERHGFVGRVRLAPPLPARLPPDARRSS